MIICTTCLKDFELPGYECKKCLKKREQKDNNELLIALQESLKLQSHYAGILNQYDQGERAQFNTIDEWVKRLKEVGRI